MKLTKDVKLIEYPRGVERANVLTHAPGAVFGAAGLFALIKKAAASGSGRIIFSAAVYGAAFLLVYLCSAVYHALPQGEIKRRARLLDHLAIPLLLAGTTTPCALVSLWRVSVPHGAAVFAAAWAVAAFGVLGKLFFFEKLKAAVIAVYFAGGSVMLFSALPHAASFDKTAFALLFAGSAVYCAAGLLCRAGIKRPVFHPVFHAVVLLGSLTHFAVIYFFIL